MCRAWAFRLLTLDGARSAGPLGCQILVEIHQLGVSGERITRLCVSRSTKEGSLMSTIYISETGDDALDGSTPETAIRSWRRAITLARGNSELHLMDLRTMERLTREIENRNRRQIYSKSQWG